MKKHDGVLDASFWINAHQGGFVDHLLTYFNLYVPTAVIQEIEYTPLDVDQLSLAGQAFRLWRQQGRIKTQDPSEPVDWYHPGENAAIAVAQEQESVLLIDDQVPYHFVKSRGLKSVSSTDFVVLLYVDKLLSYEEAEAIIARSEIGKNLKRAALAALGHLTRQRSNKVE